jgi:hypothetical protein
MKNYFIDFETGEVIFIREENKKIAWRILIDHLGGDEEEAKRYKWFSSMDAISSYQRTKYTHIVSCYPESGK